MSEVKMLEAQLMQAKATVKFSETILKLMKNKEFEEVILEQFMVKSCAEYVQRSVNPQLDESQQANALRFAQASGVLQQWLDTHLVEAERLRRAIPQIEEAIVEARQEADSDE